MLARVLARVIDINLTAYPHVFQVGKDECRLPNQKRPNSRFLHECVGRSQNSPISSICQYNTRWVRECALMELSNMWTDGLSLFLYHSSFSPFYWRAAPGERLKRPPGPCLS